MLPLVSVLSGVAALVFEGVWFHRTGLVFGNSVWATSLVLSSFMAGLGLGSARTGLRRAYPAPLRSYAMVESVVAVSGTLLTLALPSLTRAVVASTTTASASLWATNVVRFVTAFVILLVPATAMGATLPLLAGAFAARRRRFASALGSAYGWNTLGAVAGVMLAELVLITAVGVPGSAWVAGVTSLTAAALAWWEDRRRPGSTEGATAPVPTTETAPERERRAPVLALLASAFVAGGVLLALEVAWFRFLTLFVLSTTRAASLMLATVLAGIAAGGLIGGRWLGRRPHALSHMPGIAAACGISAVACYAGFGTLTSGTQIAGWPATLWLASVLTLSTSALSGLLFTMTGTAVHQVLSAGTRAVGWLGVANSAGGMIGPLIAAFVLLPRTGLEGTLALLAGAYLIVALLALWGLSAMPGPGPRGARGPSLAALAALAAAIALFPHGLMRHVHVARVAQPYQTDGSTIIDTREGPSETIFLMQQRWLGEPVYARLVTNGFSMSGTTLMAQRYMRYFAYWPAALHRGPLRRVLVICFGVGVTASAVLDLPSVETLDVAEISPDVVAMSDRLYATGHPLMDPRVRLHLEDGRQLLERTTERFDLITGEPPPPRTPGAAAIYTREYFQLVHDRLADDGVATYWLPIARPDPGTNVTAIMRAFCDVFTDCSLWNATPFDLMLVGSRGSRGASHAGPVGEDQFVLPWTIPTLRTRLAEIGLELPQQLGATFLGDAEYLRTLTADALALDDDHPHRLLPVRGRPSLSDPGYGVDQAVTGLYRSVLDPVRARARFERSPYIRGLWPPRVLDATLPYFDQQATLNQILFEGGRPLDRIEVLHDLLGRTPLRTLPLWLLGTDAVKAGIAARRDDGSGGVAYARGLTALANRDYPGAAAAFGEAERRGLVADTVRPLHAYALWVSGRVAEARALSGMARQGITDGGGAREDREDNGERRFWAWLNSRLADGAVDSRDGSR